MDTKSTGWLDRLKHRIKYKAAVHLGIDRRTTFYDLADVETPNRVAQSNVVQFYSGVPNIGNYLPVLGIRKLLGKQTDLWDAHDEEIDWEFINQNYDWAIIGGAGLLHAAFEEFWQQLASHCEIPFVVWGVGACFPDSEDDPGVAPPVARPALEKAELVNLRDDVTAKYYGMETAQISPCPTVVYLEERADSRSATTQLLYSSHTELVKEEEQNAIYTVLEESSFEFDYTNNIENRLEGLEEIVDRYARSDLVVTTRLHGAIIAYALQVPYVALARDDKVRAFHRLYGNGLSVEDVNELRTCLENRPEIEVGPIERNSVYQFGCRVQEQMIGGEPRPTIEAG